MLQRVSGHQNGYIEVKKVLLGPGWGVVVLTFGVDLGVKIRVLGSRGLFFLVGGQDFGERSQLVVVVDPQKDFD